MSILKKILKNRLLLQMALIFAGITMIVMGLLRGEALEILRKAIVVCMECIGIG